MLKKIILICKQWNVIYTLLSGEMKLQIDIIIAGLFIQRKGKLLAQNYDLVNIDM